MVRISDNHEKSEGGDFPPPFLLIQHSIKIIYIYKIPLFLSKSTGGGPRISSAMHNTHNRHPLLYPTQTSRQKWPMIFKQKVGPCQQQAIKDTGRSFSAERHMPAWVPWSKDGWFHLGTGVHFVSSLCLTTEGRS